MFKKALTQMILGSNMTREESEETLKGKHKGKVYRHRQQPLDEPVTMPEWMQIELENEHIRSMQRKGH